VTRLHRKTEWELLFQWVLKSRCQPASLPGQQAGECVVSYFEQPVLNSSYTVPERQWELDGEGRPSDRIVTSRRSSELLTALPGASAKSDRMQTSMALGGDLSTEATDISPSRIVNELRSELDAWRRVSNPAHWNVKPITQRLLQHWRAIQADDAQTIRPFFSGCRPWRKKLLIGMVRCSSAFFSQAFRCGTSRSRGPEW
jgi:hypothetical protein